MNNAAPVKNSNLSNFSDQDIRFLKKYTKLSLEKLLSLLEEQSDSDLVIDALSSGAYKKQELTKLSLKCLNLLTIFKHTKNTNFALKEKRYISDTVLAYLPALTKEKSLLSKTSKPNEHSAQYYLVMAGFFQELIEKNQTNYTSNYYISFIESGFLNAEKRDMSQHTRQWVKILNDVKKEYIENFTVEAAAK